MIFFKLLIIKILNYNYTYHGFLLLTDILDLKKKKLYMNLEKSIDKLSINLVSFLRLHKAP